MIIKKRKFYEKALEAFRYKMMPYPYHYQRDVIDLLRVSSRRYYWNLIATALESEKSFDEKRQKDSIKAPQDDENRERDNFEVSTLIDVQHWWYVSILDYKHAEICLKRSSKSFPEKKVLLQIMKEARRQRHLTTHEEKNNSGRKGEGSSSSSPRGVLAGVFDRESIQHLYANGLLWFEVVLKGDDRITIPPLEGFVMNRLNRDQFERLMYDIFVTADESYTLSELSSILDADLRLVKDAAALYCRLGFAKRLPPSPSPLQRKEKEEEEGVDKQDGSRSPAPDKGYTKQQQQQQQQLDSSPILPLHASWKQLLHAKDEIDESNRVFYADDDDDVDGNDYDSKSGSGGIIKVVVNNEEKETSTSAKIDRRRQKVPAKKQKTAIALLYDSSIVSFLMMGSMSAKLKQLSVSMYESGVLQIGRLRNDAVRSLVEELGKMDKTVAAAAGGELLEYYELGAALKRILAALQGNGRRKVDMYRQGSLSNLDSKTRMKLLRRYSCVISIAPTTGTLDLCSISSLRNYSGNASNKMSSSSSSSSAEVLVILNTRLAESPVCCRATSLLIIAVRKEERIGKGDVKGIEPVSSPPEIQSTERVKSLSLMKRIEDVQRIKSPSSYDDDQLTCVVPLPFPKKEEEGVRGGECERERKGSSQCQTEEGEAPVTITTLKSNRHPLSTSAIDLGKRISAAMAVEGALGFLRLIWDEVVGNWVPFQIHFGAVLFDRAANDVACEIFSDTGASHFKQAHCCLRPQEKSLVKYQAKMLDLRLRLETFVQQHVGIITTVQASSDKDFEKHSEKMPPRIQDQRNEIATIPSMPTHPLLFDGSQLQMLG
eukprot:jgi/Bigna1/85816/estExt_fgenesh1_pg.C_60190